MQRRVSTLFVAVASLWLIAVPAIAEEAETAFGDGDWDGMLLAAAVALVFGLVVFFMSGPHSGSDHDDHH